MGTAHSAFYTVTRRRPALDPVSVRTRYGVAAYLAFEASSRTSISARNVAKTSFRMVIPSFAASAVPGR